MAAPAAPTCCLLHSPQLLEISNRNPKFVGRSLLVQGLIEAYKLTEALRIIAPQAASKADLHSFHAASYLDCLATANEYVSSDEIADDYLTEELEQHGIAYDCPLFKGVYDYCSLVGGASITAAKCLLQKEATVAINWYGGWHHAGRDEAGGHCYCNDIVLAILKLEEGFQRILYIDLDLHHGDAVENAFSFSRNVMTVSFHKYEAGFYPGTGSVDKVGEGRGSFYSVNVPLNDGIRDQPFTELFARVMAEIKDKFEPEVVVVQCGADGLHGDPMQSFNLTIQGLGNCVAFILNWQLPTLLLGGGGYNFPNTARCWAYLTSIAVKRMLPNDIPEHQWFSQYGPDYTLHCPPGNKPDKNNVKYMAELVNTISGNLSHLSEWLLRTERLQELTSVNKVISTLSAKCDIYKK
ncbi:histone deacetylase 8-like [Dysidea avara]|uniref:histone deacetylase 8-like n=1 Tax=Dysidea avara TaxID=196820 RepID=UPI003321186B